MRKISIIVIIFFLTAGLWAQTSSVYEQASQHYRVSSEVSRDHAAETAQRLEALMELYNTYFHFDLSGLGTKLNVRIFSTKNRFDSYLTRIIDETRDDFVYLHYSDLQKSELVGYYQEWSDYDIGLNHQSFIQFFRSFISNPPLWLREGFAVFFERVEWDEEFNRVQYKENLAWLETLKKIIAGTASVTPLTLDEILTIDVETARKKINSFYPQAWGMVSFLVNSPNKEHNRILWDSISALKPSATLAENAAAINQNAFKWAAAELKLQEEFISYVDSRKSFRTLVQDGIDSYGKNELDSAEESFVKALQIEDKNYIPYYYLGLINYERKNYSLADYYYSQALDLGAIAALTYYAMGVNAYADNRFDEAETYLKKTIDLDPTSYKEKSEELLTRMKSFETS